MGIVIREATPEDAPFLQRMLLAAAHVPDADTASPEDVFKDHPDLIKYVDRWGSRPQDMGFVAVHQPDGQPVGAVWLRLFASHENGLAYIDDETPELAIGVSPEQRGQGIGTRLLVKLLQEARKCSHGAVALSCRTDNFVMKMYERAGFHRVDGMEFTNRTGGTSVVMKIDLSHPA